MATIKNIWSAQRFDSRGNPTVQVVIETELGSFKAIVPSGASKGDYEAIELRDGGKAYHGRGVLKAVENVEKIIWPAIKEKGYKCTEQEQIDKFMVTLDGTKDKSNLGANAILGVSMALARAGAAASNQPLYTYLANMFGSKEPLVMPVPFFNVLNGGVHSGNPMAIQEMMIAPVGATSFTEAMQMGTEVYQELKEILKAKFGPSAIGVGDEGGFSPPINRPEEGFDLLQQAIANCGYTGKVRLAMDPASTEFYKNGNYDLDFKKTKGLLPKHHTVLSPAKLADMYNEIIAKYDLVLLEDPFAQDDFDAWTMFNKDIKIELVGDDLLATNPERIKMAADKKACNSLLLKINQIGTISESMEAAHDAYNLNWSIFVSHRSGETTDDFIADLTVALKTGHLKTGSPCRGERLAKYNRLLDIEREIGSNVPYAGISYKEARFV